MRVRIFQLDAFTTKHFIGNLAAVMLLDVYPSDSVLQAVAVGSRVHLRGACVSYMQR
jgi:predicted PhzF superfamily epimerase YddE/YHI9